MARQGKCTNWGACKLADEGTVQDISEAVDFVCQECGKELTEITGKQGRGKKPRKGGDQGTGFPIVRIVVVSIIVLGLLIGIGFGGYIGYKIWKIKTLITLFTEAVNIKDLSDAEDVLTRLGKWGEIAEHCPECVEKFQELLMKTFETLLKEGKLDEAREILSKFQIFGESDACVGCEERIAEVESKLPYQKNFTLLPVEAGNFQFSDYLKRYLGYLGSDSISISEPFSVFAGEVTVAQFREYVNSLDDAARTAMGTLWERDADGNPYQDNRPVENVSWQDAQNYAQWLSAKTGWTLQLPTRAQWAAACVKYPDPQPILGRIDKASEPLSVFRPNLDIDHLLGNVREWSADSCGEGKYYLLGENYMTDPTDPEAVGKPNCAQDAKWSGVGFRLIRMDN